MPLTLQPMCRQAKSGFLQGGTILWDCKRHYLWPSKPAAFGSLLTNLALRWQTSPSTFYTRVPVRSMAAAQGPKIQELTLGVAIDVHHLQLQLKKTNKAEQDKDNQDEAPGVTGADINEDAMEAKEAEELLQECMQRLQQDDGRQLREMEKHLEKDDPEASCKMDVNRWARRMSQKRHEVEHRLNMEADFRSSVKPAGAAAAGAGTSASAAAASSSSKPAGDDSNEVNTCPLCLDVIDRFTFTSCGHTFCSDCIHELVENAAVQARKCPICRKMLSQSDLMDSVSPEEAEALVELDTKCSEYGAKVNKTEFQLLSDQFHHARRPKKSIP